MNDSQKISFDDFLLGYKHGLYVFTKDSCDACVRYKKDLEWIESCYLYFVETPLIKQEAILEKLTGRSTFPQTVAYEDNQIKFVRTGVEFDKQQVEILLPFLKKLGTEPLTPEEIERRIQKQKNRCLLTLYVFSKDIPEEKRKELVLKGAEINEFAIDVSHVGEGLPDSERERLLEGQYHSCKLALFKPTGQQSTLGDFEQRIVLGFAAVNQEITFEVRDV